VLNVLIKCPESLKYYAQSGDVHGLIAIPREQQSPLWDVVPQGTLK